MSAVLVAALDFTQGSSAVALAQPAVLEPKSVGLELGAITLLVMDEDRAVAWHERNLGLRVAANSRAADGERFVAMKAAGQPSLLIVLHRPRTTDIKVNRAPFL